MGGSEDGTKALIFFLIRKRERKDKSIPIPILPILSIMELLKKVANKSEIPAKKQPATPTVSSKKT